jgi:hypothetical protein
MHQLAYALDGDLDELIGTLQARFDSDRLQQATEAASPPADEDE